MNKKGFVLISTYMIVSVLLIIGTLFVVRSISEKRAASYTYYNLAALNAAEAGLDRGLNYLRNRHGNPPSNTVIPYSLQALGTNCRYTVTIVPNATDTDRFSIESRGEVNTVSGWRPRTLVNEVGTDDYARYAYFTDREEFNRNRVWFITRDSLNGPVQTNGQFHISGSPTFDDTTSNRAVKTSFSSIDYMHGGPPTDNPQFNTGIAYNQPPVDLPTRALELRIAAVQEGRHLNGDTEIVLLSDGTMNIKNYQDYSDYNFHNESRPSNNAVFVTGGDLTVSGTLDGPLTMGTNRDIYIKDNIAYANCHWEPDDCPTPSDPATVCGKVCDDPEGNDPDVLGLIAHRDILISDEAPYNVEVDASIMALGSSFMVEDWYGPNKGTLSVYGGIIQRERGPVGTFNSATITKLSGYSKNYVYDPRLAAPLFHPPFYPKTYDYVNLYWQDNQYTLEATSSPLETPLGPDDPELGL